MLWLCFLLVPVAHQATADKEQSSTSQSKDSKKPQPTTESTEDSPNSPATPAKLLKWEYDATLKDIDKLVKLTTEIREDMEKAGENVLPVATLKKLDEVERLTRKIRGRIKQ